MVEGVRDLYIELFRIFNRVSNKRGATILAALLVSILMMLNLFSVIYILQRPLNIDVTGFLIYKKSILLLLFFIVLSVNTGISFTIAGQLKEELEAYFFKPRMGFYIAWTFVLGLIAFSMALFGNSADS